jgi:hypothetical protein
MNTISKDPENDRGDTESHNIVLTLTRSCYRRDDTTNTGEHDCAFAEECGNVLRISVEAIEFDVVMISFE